MAYSTLGVWFRELKSKNSKFRGFFKFEQKPVCKESRSYVFFLSDRTVPLKFKNRRDSRARFYPQPSSVQPGNMGNRGRDFRRCEVLFVAGWTRFLFCPPARPKTEREVKLVPRNGKSPSPPQVENEFAPGFVDHLINPRAGRRFLAGKAAWSTSPKLAANALPLKAPPALHALRGPIQGFPCAAASYAPGG